MPFVQEGYDGYYIEASNADNALSYYESAYADATDSADPSSMDRLAVAEQAMLDSGSLIPEGNISAADLQGQSPFDPNDLI